MQQVKEMELVFVKKNHEGERNTASKIAANYIIELLFPKLLGVDNFFETVQLALYIVDGTSGKSLVTTHVDSLNRPKLAYAKMYFTYLMKHAGPSISRSMPANQELYPHTAIRGSYLTPEALRYITAYNCMSTETEQEKQKNQRVDRKFYP